MDGLGDVDQWVIRIEVGKSVQLNLTNKVVMIMFLHIIRERMRFPFVCWNGISGLTLK